MELPIWKNKNSAIFFKVIYVSQETCLKTNFKYFNPANIYLSKSTIRSLEKGVSLCKINNKDARTYFTPFL